jgi:hypothetical protein
MVVHSYNPILGDRDQEEWLEANPGKNSKPYPKNYKSIKGWGCGSSVRELA